MLTVEEIQEHLSKVKSGGGYSSDSGRSARDAETALLREFRRLRAAAEDSDGLRALLTERAVEAAREQVALEHRIAELEAQLDFQGREAMRASQHADDCVATIIVSREQAEEMLRVAGAVVHGDRWCITVDERAQA